MKKGPAMVAAAAAIAAAGAAAWAQEPGTARLPLSIAALMRAGVEVSSQGIFAVQYEEKLADDDWLLVDQDAANLAFAGTLMLSAGTGPKDAEWVAAPDWRQWAGTLQQTALKIRAAAAAKDLAALGPLGDELLETCTACHAKYRPENATDGIARYPFYPQRKRVATPG